MPIFHKIYDTILEALFPRSLAEIESLSYSPEEAWGKLPRAPKTPLEDSFSIFAYKDERVAKLVWNVKYKESKQAIAIGGYALHKHLIATLKQSSPLQKELPAQPCMNSTQQNEHTTPAFRNLTQQNFIAVPIPITKKRRNERGYNQCELLVDEMKRLDTENSFTVRKDLLERVQHLSRQTLKDRKDRLESAKGIFGMNDLTMQKLFATKTDIENSVVIVIDDVITTGSTMKEAMTTLKNTGFKNVFGLSLAH